MQLSCFLLLLSCLAGCSSRLKTYPVKGRVEFENGAPVVMGTVELQSIEYKVNARGNIQPDGSFELTTFEENDGAVGGNHKCVVIQMVIAENIPGYRPSTTGVVARRFADYQTSGLTCYVSDKDNEITLTVHGIRKDQPDTGEDHEHDAK